MIKLFTHTDLDGIGCAVLAKIAFGDEVDIEYCNYNNVNEKIEAFMGTTVSAQDKIYITDISVNEEIAERIDSYSLAQWKLFDHHATAEWLNKYSWAKVRTDRITFVGPFKTCGTELFYEHLVQKGCISGSNKILREFVNFVRDCDTWAWKTYENGQPIKQFNDLLYILGRDKFIERCLTRYKGNKRMVQFSKDEQKFIDQRQAEIDAYVKKKMKEAACKYVILDSGQGLMCAVVFAERFISELGNRICEESEQIDGFVDCAVIIDMGARKISYRATKDDVDVSELARVFGGGGHKKAAGNYFDLEVLLEATNDLLWYAEHGVKQRRPIYNEVAVVDESGDVTIEKPKKRFKLFGRK